MDDGYSRRHVDDQFGIRGPVSGVGRGDNSILMAASLRVEWIFRNVSGRVDTI